MKLNMKTFWGVGKAELKYKRKILFKFVRSKDSGFW